MEQRLVSSRISFARPRVEAQPEVAATSRIDWKQVALATCAVVTGWAIIAAWILTFITCVSAGRDLLAIWL